jgi:hypothetical protein
LGIAPTAGVEFEPVLLIQVLLPPAME